MQKGKPAFVENRTRKISLLLILFCFAFTAHAQSYKEFRAAVEFSKNYQIDSAYKHMQKAMKLSSKSAEKQKAQIFIRYGKLLKLREQTDSCFYYFRKADDIFEKYNNRDSILYTAISMAELFRFCVMPQKAAFYIKQAEKMVTAKTPDDILAYYYNRRGAIEAMFFSKAYALELSNKVIAMQHKVRDKEIIIYSYNEMGYMYERSHPDKSFAAYSAALALAEAHNLLIPKADVLVLLSRLPQANEIQCLEQAYEIARSVNNKDMMLSISKRLLDPYVARKNYVKAYEHSQNVLKLESEMYDSRALAKTAEMEGKYNLSKAEQALTLKNTEVQSARKNLLLTFIVAVLSLLVLVTVIYFYRKSRRSNKKLAILSEENEFLLSEANHRINNNLQLIIILISDELRKLASSEEQASLQKILSKVESIATLHRHLYKAEDKHSIDSGEYLKELLGNFSDLFSEQGITTAFTIENVMLQNEVAIYMGLLVTELSINTLKYAFAGQADKQIQFSYTQKGNTLAFRFSDNGEAVRGKTVSPKLVLRLCRQLKVESTINTGNGFLFYFEKNLN